MRTMVYLYELSPLDAATAWSEKQLMAGFNYLHSSLFWLSELLAHYGERCQPFLLPMIHSPLTQAIRIDGCSYSQYHW